MSVNPFARKKGEPTTEELLAAMNKPLPFSDEAEKSTLSSLLQDPNGRISEASMSLPPAAFYHEANRLIYEKLLEFYAKQIPIDPVMVTNAMRDQNLLDRVGGPSAITELFTFVPSPAHYLHYKKIVLDKYHLRRFIGAMARGIQMFQTFGSVPNNDDTLESVVEHVREIFAEVEHDDGSPDLPCVPIKQLVNKVVTQAAERAENPGRMLGVPYGFTGIDKDTSGVQTGQFITILGGTSMGKSLLSRQIIESWCKAGHHGVIYSWEMQDTQETTRLLCSQGQISNESFKLGTFTRGEQMALEKACKTVSEWPIDIVDCGGRYIEDVWRDIHRRAKRLPPGVNLLVEIDYLQLAPTRRKFNSGDRQKQIAYITQGCKQAAKSSKRTADSPPRVAILGLSQVNRDGEAREADDIINDSDVAIMIEPVLMKEEGKMPWQKKAAKPGKKEFDDTRATLFLPKVRDGKRYNRYPVRKMGEFFRFEERLDEQTTFDDAA